MSNDRYDPFYQGQLRNQRYAAVNAGLATLSEINKMSDEGITKLINDSDLLILRDGDDYALIPREIENKIIWINR